MKKRIGQQTIPEVLRTNSMQSLKENIVENVFTLDVLDEKARFHIDLNFF